jgi:hypothetical protein
MHALFYSPFVRIGPAGHPSQEGSPGNTKTDSETSYGSPRAESADRPHVRHACVGRATVKSLPGLSRDFGVTLGLDASPGFKTAPSCRARLAQPSYAPAGCSEGEGGRGVALGPPLTAAPITPLQRTHARTCRLTLPFLFQGHQPSSGPSNPCIL